MVTYVWVEINNHDVKQQTVLWLRRITQPCPFMFRIKQITLCEEKRGSFTCYMVEKKESKSREFPKDYLQLNDMHITFTHYTNWGGYQVDMSHSEFVGKDAQ